MQWPRAHLYLLARPLFWRLVTGEVRLKLDGLKLRHAIYWTSELESKTVDRKE